MRGGDTAQLRREREDNVLKLYHNMNSVCAQKVRIALEEKGQEAEEHLLTLRGDQNEPAYLKLNLPQERKVPRRGELLQRRVRGDSLHSAAGAAPARRPVGGLSRHRGLVGAHARAALGQGGDLRSHDREGLGAVQEPRARSLAQGARAAASQLNPDRSNSRWARRRRARTRLKPR